MILETAHSSQTKLIGYDLQVGEQGIGYSNLTPDPQGARVRKLLANNRGRTSAGISPAGRLQILADFTKPFTSIAEYDCVESARKHKVRQIKTKDQLRRESFS